MENLGFIFGLSGLSFALITYQQNAELKEKLTKLIDELIAKNIISEQNQNGDKK